jgi:hypothetical protein
MRKPQISASLEPELVEIIKDEAKKDNRSFSEMVEMLLRQAIKERERTRAKNARRKPVESN